MRRLDFFLPLVERGLTMSLEGGLEELPEFLLAAARDWVS